MEMSLPSHGMRNPPVLLTIHFRNAQPKESFSKGAALYWHMLPLPKKNDSFAWEVFLDALKNHHDPSRVLLEICLSYIDRSWTFTVSKSVNDNFLFSVLDLGHPNRIIFQNRIEAAQAVHLFE